MNMQQYEQAGNLLLEKQRLEELKDSILKSEKINKWVSIDINGLMCSIKPRFYNKLVNLFNDEINEVNDRFEKL